jgi:hypothetical protein
LYVDAAAIGGRNMLLQFDRLTASPGEVLD